MASTPGPRWPGARASLLVVPVVVAVVIAGCVGATDRQDFVDEVRLRGGGFDREVIEDSLDALTDELGGDPELLDLTYTPLTTAVVVRARNPGTDDVDSWNLVGGGVRNRTPVRLGAGADIDASTFPVSAVDPEVVSTAVEESRELAGLADGWVEKVAIAVGVHPEVPDQRLPLLTVTIESDRSTVEVRLDLDGRVLGQEGP